MIVSPFIGEENSKLFPPRVFVRAQIEARAKKGLNNTGEHGSMGSGGSWVTAKRKGRKWPNLRIDLTSLLFHFQDICKGIDVARRKGNA